MKNILILFGVLLGSIQVSVAGNNQSQALVEFTNTDTTVKTQLNNVLLAYYDVKDALVKDNEKLALNKAKALVASLNAVDMKKLSPAEHNFFMPLQEKLLYDAEHISKAPNIDHAREHFSSLSKNIWSLTFAFKANNGIPAYKDYCPMQKAIWVSKDEGIKNPYYGSQMMSCGKVTDTLK